MNTIQFHQLQTHKTTYTTHVSI